MASKTILIVEDEKIVALDISAQLIRLGYTVTGIAGSGEEAIQAVATTEPDLVLMDIRLSGDMDGIDTAEQIRDRFNTAVVFLTAHADTGTLERAKQLAPYGYLIKPFNANQLKTTIEIALYKHEIAKKERQLTRKLQEEIAERTRVEVALRANERKLRNIIDQSTDGIGLVDEVGVIIEWNQAYEEITGLERSGVLGQPLWDIQQTLSLDPMPRPSANYDQMKQMILDALQTGHAPWLNRPLEDEIKRSDGARRVLQTIVFPIRAERGFMLCSMVRDITARKRAEETLRESEEKYRLLFENMTAGFALHEMIYDDQGQPTDYRFLEINPAFEKLTGVPAATLLGKTVKEVLPNTEQYWIDVSGKVAQTGEPIAYQNYSGELDRYYDTWLFSSTKDQFAVVFTDITERKQAERALQENEKLMRRIAENYPNSYLSIIEEDYTVGFTAGQEFRTQKLDPEQFIGLTLEQVFGDQTSIVRLHYEKTFKGEESSFELFINNQHLLYHAIPLHAEDGSVLRILAVAENITKRVEVEKALRESEEQYRDLVENLNDVIFTTDDKGMMIYVSPSIEAFLGYSPPEVMGQPFAQFIHPEDLHRITESFQNMTAGGPYRGPNEYRGVTKSGVVRWMRTSSRPILLGDHIVGVQGTLADITERRQAEEALQESLARTEALYHASRTLIAIQDLPDLLQMVVDEVIAALSADRATLISVDLPAEQVTQFVKSGPGSQNVVQVAFDELRSGLTGWVLRENKPVLSPHGTPDLRESLEVQRRRVETNCGDIIVVPLHYRSELLGTMTAINRPEQRDFTQQDVELMVALANQAAIAIENSRLVHSLRQSEEKFFKAFRASPDPMIISALADGRYIDINESFLRATGYGRNEVIGRTSVELLVWSKPEDRARFVQKIQEHGVVRNFEAAFRKKSGQIGSLLMSAEIIELNDERCLLTISKDITEHRQAEQQQLELAVERERAAVLQQFVNNASHDLRTPLTTIKTRLYLLEKSADLERLHAHVEVLEAQTTHLERLLEDMLRMSRLDAVTRFRFETLDVNAMIQAILARQGPLVRRKNHHMHFAGDPQIPFVQADKLHLSRATTNIVVNALHYTPDKGDITIRTYTHEHYVVIEVCDTGVGIGTDDLPHIFERFYRADKARGTIKGGAGLGLAIAKKVIEKHQGNIEVESELGKGSTFRILLPISN